MISDSEIERLLSEAIDAGENAYAPYSGYRVGAALLTESGEMFKGCNVENAAFTPGSCAERTALNYAVASGFRSFKAIAVAGGGNGKSSRPAYPCGVCRQVLREFADDDFCVICADRDGHYEIHTLGELLPFSFGPENL